MNNNGFYHSLLQLCLLCLLFLGIKECVMFETEDLVARKNEKHVIFTLLDVARYGAHIGILAPLIVQYEREIDEEINSKSR